MEDNKQSNNNSRNLILYQNIVMTIGLIVIAGIFILLLYAGYKIKNESKTFSTKITTFNHEVTNINSNLNNIDKQLKTNNNALNALSSSGITKIP